MAAVISTHDDRNTQAGWSPEIGARGHVSPPRSQDSIRNVRYRFALVVMRSSVSTSSTTFDLIFRPNRMPLRGSESQRRIGRAFARGLWPGAHTVLTATFISEAN